MILPLTVLRRFDCVLADTKAAVLAAAAEHTAQSDNVRRRLLESAAGRPFYNTSHLTFTRLLDDPNRLPQNLNAYIRGFSANVVEIMERFGFEEHIARMAERDLLFEVVKAFASLDLSPERVDNMQMGYVFEELIRVGAEQANEEAGEHFTPREVIRLMVSLLLAPEPDLGKGHVVKTIYDPACGDRGHALSRRGIPARTQQPIEPDPLRPGLERRRLGGLQGRHADQGRQRREHHPRRHVHRGRPQAPQRWPPAVVRLHAR